MYSRLFAGLSGFVFALGLVFGGMTDPDKVLAFLDVTGDWDPSLALVMGAAILVYAPGFRLVTKRPAPIFDPKFHLPTRKDIDLRLILGAVLFGAGWGLGGLCPGPAIVSVMSFIPETLAFVAAMLGGMAGFAAWERSRAKRSSAKV